MNIFRSGSKSLMKNQQLLETIALRCLSTSYVSSTKSPIQNVVVLGGGLMGAGIVQVAAQSHFKVAVIDPEDESLQKCMLTIKKSLNRLTKKKFPDQDKAAQSFSQSVLDNISTYQEIKGCEAIADCDLLIEAVPERMDLKHSIFAELEAAAPSKTIFTSNTSSLPITEIGKPVNRVEKFAGLHFFNPVPVMKLVEVIKTDNTSPGTLDTLERFVKDLGKTPVMCKDTPGFIVNRLLVPYLIEAIRMLERGDATKEDIDVAMKFGATYPMGPFELLDYVGLDTTKFIIDGWHEKEPNNPLFNPSTTLNDLVAKGKFGRKTGEGFYKYR